MDNREATDPNALAPATGAADTETETANEGGLTVEQRVARLERVAEFFLVKFTGGDALADFNPVPEDNAG